MARIRATAGALALLLVATAAAADPRPQPAAPAADLTSAPAPQFTFRKIAAPARGTAGRRITVQIDPVAQAAALAALPKAKPWTAPSVPPEAGAAPGAFARFWAQVSPRLQDASSGRLEDVLRAVATDTDLPGPRLDDIRRITDRYGRDILRLTVGTGVSPALVAAVISVESAGRPDAVSHAGAAGLMQLMPATAERFGVADRSKPLDNMRGGIAYLGWLLREFDRDPVMALAGYNAGENAVKAHQGVPPYAETLAYVPKVLAAYRVAAGLCLTPPQLISDGCVFAGI